jgi:hypothetical protein
MTEITLRIRVPGEDQEDMILAEVISALEYAFDEFDSSDTGVEVQVVQNEN